MKKTILFVLVLAFGVAEVCHSAEDTWTSKVDMPTATSLHSASVVNGKIYVIGGTDNLYRVHATRNYVIIYAKDNGDILVARIADRKGVYKDLKTLRKIIKKFTK